jgi:hypothetical protein
MKLRNLLLGIALLSLSAAIAAIAQEATTAPSEEHHTRAHVIAPYNLITDLSDDQKAKISEIHRSELEQEHALREKEHDDIMAVLNDDQKKELDAAIARITEERKAAGEERRAKTEEERAQELKNQAEGGAATQPSGQ